MIVHYVRAFALAVLLLACSGSEMADSGAPEPTAAAAMRPARIFRSSARVRPCRSRRIASAGPTKYRFKTRSISMRVSCCRQGCGQPAGKSRCPPDTACSVPA